MKIFPVQQNIQPRQFVSYPSVNDYSADKINGESLAFASGTYGKSQVNFKANFSAIQSAVEKIPLEDKLAHALKKLRTGEYIILTKDLASQVSKLKPCIQASPFLINKITLLQDKTLEQSLIFTKFGEGQSILFNPNTEPINISWYQLLKPNGATMVDESDKIVLSNQILSVKEEPDSAFDTERYAKYFLKEYDFKQDARDTAVKYNVQKLMEVVNPKNQKKAQGVTFSDVGGQKEVIDILKKRILFPMLYPDIFKNNNMNHGVILFGPPGTGKSLLAEALANESGATVFKICATDLNSKFVGESEKNWRELFADAQTAEPSIIYIDEFDAVARQRGSIDVYGDKLMNQLLSLMSNLEKNKANVYLIAATNNYESIDPAILRSGRFGLHLEVKAPNLEGTKEILKIHTKKKQMAKDFDIDKISEMMYSKRMTGADIASVVDSAYSNAFDRLGFYKEMDERRFTPSMMAYFEINNKDLTKAIESFEAKKKTRKPIGYK